MNTPEFDAMMYAQLPAYAGIEDVQRPGWTVDESAQRLARLAAVVGEMSRIACARISSEPVIELKSLYARMAHECALGLQSLEGRLKELRNQARLVERVLDYQIGDFLREAMHSNGSIELAAAYFRVLIPELLQAIESYLGQTNPLADYPTVRVLKHLRLDLEEHQATGDAMMNVLIQNKEFYSRAAAWEKHLRAYLSVAGGMLGDAEIPGGLRAPAPVAQEEFRIPPEFARDERFQKMIPKAHPLLPEYASLDKAAPATLALFQMMWARSQEVAAAELCFSVAYDWEEMPTEFLCDLTRHGWDEMRHSLFGRAALQSVGVEIWQVPAWIGYARHTMPYPPTKRYAHLTIAIEEPAMRHPGGKRGQWEFCRDEAQHPLMTTFQDFDWADEVVHVHFGRRWLTKHYFDGDRNKARALGDESMNDRNEFYKAYEQSHPSHP